jgi:hypothetical protein
VSSGKDTDETTGFTKQGGPVEMGLTRYMSGEEFTQFIAQPPDEALRLSRRGWPVFPCYSNKKPRTAHGFKDATCVEARICEWWQSWPDALVGVATGAAKLVVIDVDIKDGKTGDQTLKNLEAEHGELPATHKVKTRSGGWHLYFQRPDNADIGCSAGKLGPGVDVRAEGGYVIAAGPGYAVEDDSPDERAELPEAWVQLLTAQSQTAIAVEAQATVSDVNPTERDSALLHLHYEEDFGRDWWLKVLMAYKAGGGDYDTFHKWSNQQPGFKDERTLRREWDSVRPAGGVTPATLFWAANKQGWHAQDAVHPAVDRSTDGTSTALPDSRPELRIETVPADFDLANIPRRQWIIRNRILAGSVVALLAPGGIGKSTFTLSLAASVVLGKELLFANGKVEGRGPVWVINNEDPLDELYRRVAGLMCHHNIPVADLIDRLFLTPGFGEPVVFNKSEGHTVIRTPDVEAVIRHIREKGIRLLIVDPFVSTHDVEENDNGAIDQALNTFKYIAAETGVAVLLVHHTRKGGGDSEQHAGDQDAGRGASAMVNACRQAFTLARMSEKTGNSLKLPLKLRPHLVRLDSAKASYAAPDSKAHWFELKGVDLDNGGVLGEGDTVAVTVPFDLDNAPQVETDKDQERSEREGQRLQDLGEIMSKEPHVRLLSDVLHAVMHRWQIKPTAAREAVMRLIPPESETPVTVKIKSGLSTRMYARRDGEHRTALISVVAEILDEELSGE